MPNRAPWLSPHAVAVLATAIAAAVRALLLPFLGQDAPLLIFSLAVMFAAASGGLWPGISATLLGALAGWLFFIQPTLSLRLERSQDAAHVLLFLGIGAAISLLSARLRGAQQRAESALRDLERSRQDLAIAYEREHRVAESLQRSLVVKPDPDAFPGLVVELFYEPASEEAVGGDFYDALPLPAGRVALVVGDVSGKGLDAASRTAEAKFAVRAFLRESPYPAYTLRRLDRFLRDAEALEGRAGGAFVSLALAVINPETGEALLSLAGAEPPMIVRAADKRTEVADLGGMPLGAGFLDNEPYPSQALLLGPEDTLLLFTDGLTEARREDGEILDHAGVARLARQAAALPTLHETGAAILAGAHDWAGGKLADDTCLLLVRRRDRAITTP